MGIFGQIQGPVRGVIGQLMDDPDLRTKLTYRKFTARAWSESEGAQVSTYNETTPYCIRLRHTDKSRLVGISEIQVGDQLYLLDYRDCPAGMSLKDEIVDDLGITQKVKNVTNIFNLAVAVTVEGGESGVGA